VGVVCVLGSASAVRIDCTSPLIHQEATAAGTTAATAAAARPPKNSTNIGTVNSQWTGASYTLTCIVVAVVGRGLVEEVVSRRDVGARVPGSDSITADTGSSAPNTTRQGNDRQENASGERVTTLQPVAARFYRARTPKGTDLKPETTAATKAKTATEEVVCASTTPDDERGVDEEVGVRPARVLQEVSPDDLVEAGVDDRLEELVRVPDEDNEGDPHRLVHVGQEVEDAHVPFCPGWVGISISAREWTGLCRLGSEAEPLSPRRCSRWLRQKRS